MRRYLSAYMHEITAWEGETRHARDHAMPLAFYERSVE